MPEKTQNSLVECFICKCVSKKTGRPYSVLHINFENGYTLQHFLTDEQLFIIGSICPIVNDD